MNVRDKVLIVEDDEGIRKFLSTTLIANGYWCPPTVRCASCWIWDFRT